MKISGIVLNSNLYKDRSYIFDFLDLNNNRLINFKANGLAKNKSKNKPTLSFLNIIDCEIIENKKNHKYLFINGKTIININEINDLTYGIFFINCIKEILYKLVLKDDLIKCKDELYFIINLINKFKNNEILLILTVYFLLFILDINGLNYNDYLISNHLDNTILKIFNDKENLINIKITNKELIEILKIINEFISESFSTKINSINILL